MILFSKDASPWVMAFYLALTVLGGAFLVKAVVNQKWTVPAVGMGMYVVFVAALFYSRARQKRR